MAWGLCLNRQQQNHCRCLFISVFCIVTLCVESTALRLHSHDTGTQSPDSDNVQYQDWKTTRNITLQQSLLSLFLYSIAEQYMCLIELVVHCSSCLNRALRRVFHARLTDPLLDHFQVIVNSSTYSWMVSHSAWSPGRPHTWCAVCAHVEEELWTP